MSMLPLLHKKTRGPRNRVALTEIEKLAGKRVLGLNISPHRLKRTKNKAPEISTLAVQLHGRRL